MIRFSQLPSIPFASLALLFASLPVVAEERDYQQRTDAYFADRVEELAARTAMRIDGVTPENWDEHRAAWRTELQDMLGLLPLPPKTDLKPTITGTLEHDGLTIHKLHYQSSPKLYVTANLYLPAGEAPDKGWPAVLYVCGHANVRHEGRLMGNKTGYHHHGLWFARHDVACLTIDTIQLGELHGTHHGTHHLGRWDWISRGYTPVGVETWNAMRGIDYLETRDDIDADAIGITGRSGGGAYSWYTAAIDERIKAAVPVAGITDLENHVLDDCVAGHCDCMYMVNHHRWDYPLLGALIAPRPLLLANSDTDSIFPLDGVMRVHWRIKQTYDQLDASENYAVLITPGPHKDTQELQVGAFRWLLKHLTGTEPVVSRAATKELEPQQLLVFENEIPKDERLTSVSGWFVPQAAAAPSKWDWIWHTAQFDLPTGADAARKTLHRSPEAIIEGQTETHQWELLQFVTADPLVAHAVRVKPNERAGHEIRYHVGLTAPFATATTAGISEALASAPVQSAFRDAPDATHVFLIPRESGWNRIDGSGSDQTHHLRKYYLLGETAQSGQLHDIMRILYSLGSAADSNSRQTLAGYKEASVLTALVAIAFDEAGSTTPSFATLGLYDYPTTPRLAPALPGWLRIASLESVLATAKKRFNVTERTARPAPTTTQHDAALDPDSAPQLANGMRIVEVGADSADVWTRLTRWSMPNLPDLDTVEFKNAAGKQSSGAVLPEDGIAGLAYAVPGAPGVVRVRYKARPDGAWQETPWRQVDPATDYSQLFALESLQPATHYDVRVEARPVDSESRSDSLSGSFTTLPSADAKRDFRLAVGTCQSFIDRDGPHGFDLYRTLQDRDVDAFILAGDVVYYDALARSVPLAHYHWQRTYSLPTVVDFQRSVPTYFLKDDHDTYVNDSWPGEHRRWTEAFTFEAGQRIFKEQTGLPNPPYRTLRMGRDLQVWMLEGRDDRSANPSPDGPEKTIWGEAQWNWLRETMEASDAKFKVIVSPTPLVGPDRKNKNDNLANKGFTHEGDRARAFLAEFPNTVVVCGDRHWQYHSVDPDTGLHEFSVGPVSDRHAGGWKQDDYRESIHRFLRVDGGYLEIDLAYDGDASSLSLIHRTVAGESAHRYEMN